MKKDMTRASKEQQLREMKEIDTDSIKKYLELMEKLLELNSKFIDPFVMSFLDKEQHDDDQKWLEWSVEQYRNELRLRSN